MTDFEQVLISSYVYMLSQSSITLEACHRLALIEGQKENKKRKGNGNDKEA
ncbi:MAG: hypothetical protein OEW62_11210 [Candidatus Bathyarchaeota archaeon]|nr:hypothetical protein [Candidatus Bathyarchaeota archaeon]